MKRLFIATFTTLLCTSSFAQQYLSERVALMGKATNWNKARQMCEGLGENWKLPSSHMEFFTNEKLASHVPAVELNSVWSTGSMTVFEGSIYPLWISLDEQTDKDHFEGTSNVLYMQDGKGTGVALLDISRSALSRYSKEAKANKKKLSRKEQFRTEEEMELVYKEVEEINEAYRANGGKGQRWFNLDVSGHAELSAEANAILKKPDAKKYELAIQNLETVSQFFQEGLRVICVR